MVVQLALKAIPAIGKAGWKVLVPLGAATVAAVGVGAKGVIDTARGRSIRNTATQRFDEAISQCDAAQRRTEELARDYGAYQIQVHAQSVGRLADWLERNEHLVKRLNFKKVDGVRIRVPNIPKYVAAAENVTTGVTGLVSAVGAGVSAQAAAVWGVSAFATAGTGTAISSLSGAAAQSATLAWLGGGPIAAGGGGVAAGSAVLGLVTVVPVLLVGGFTMGVAGARTKTKAHGFAASVNVEIERIKLVEDLLGAVGHRIEELRETLGNLAKRATEALDRLESVDFDPNLHAREFVQALQLVTAVKEVLSTPVLDPSTGELTEASVEILRKYA
ncbi:hypothetical protein [Cellulomonas biazotea]|uniref:Uncharacterized protein n=1 Tax=Cellulomonas biazotea TaxID=1709 RepID=A0A402DNF8_9CELL|nr:hypothetical protein [Cellulomonas biazotea]GCE75638.1 hypothetical protein CBZ_06940 [Cellulomonas biazotea]